MVFSSLTFLFFFFAPVLIIYFILPGKVCKNAVLLVASLIFYSWGEPKLLFLMLSATLAAYLGGLAISHFDERDNKRLKKTAFIITVLLLTANLFIFKYLNFAVDNINLIFGSEIKIKEIVLPIGISFYTFQILSYVIDLYNKKVSLQKNYFYLTLYVSFFPQLIAGPIVRYQTIEAEICQRQVSAEDISEGLKRFIAGLAKKVIIANNTAKIAEIIYAGEAHEYGTLLYWLAAIAYTLQIYFDFSGYSDMAIGMGRIFGFHFLENFNYPYTSSSITDFWRRWHISLSGWFKDYIYIPLGGNRVGIGRHIFNIFVVWALTGLWHGAKWNFVIWGIYYAVLLVLEKYFIGKVLEKLPKFFGWAYSMFFVIIGWVIFNLTDSEKLFTALETMFCYVPANIMSAVAKDTDILFAAVYIPIGILCMFPVFKRRNTNNTYAVRRNFERTVSFFHT